MKVTLSNKFPGIGNIEFCCMHMCESVVTSRQVKFRHYDDKEITSSWEIECNYNNVEVVFCPYCGAEVKTFIG